MPCQPSPSCDATTGLREEPRYTLLLCHPSLSCEVTTGLREEPRLHADAALSFFALIPLSYVQGGQQLHPDQDCPFHL